MSRCGSCPAYGCGAFGIHCSGDYGVEECSDTLQELYNAAANELYRLKNQALSAADEGIKKTLTDWRPELNHIMLGSEDRMRILVVEPACKPEVREIIGTLESMQEIVGGLIQALYPFEEPVALVCNDEGKLMNLPANRGLRDKDGHIYDIVAGIFFLCGAPADCDHFTSLSPEQIKRYEERFHTPEMFWKLDGQIVCLPMEDN